MMPHLRSIAGLCTRLLAIASAWLVVVGAGMTCFFGPRGTEVQPTTGDLVGFGCAMAIAGGTSASVALFLGGRRRLAAEVAMVVVLASAIAYAALLVVLWGFPMLLRSRMDAWAFLRLRDGARLWRQEVLGFQGPLGLIVGGAAGLVVGLLAALERRRPRRAAWLALGLLLLGASEPGRQLVSGLTVATGLLIRMRIRSHGLTDAVVSATGAVLGAIAGAVVAGSVMHAARRRERAR